MKAEYYGTMSVKAEPILRQAYCDLKGWTLPDDENGADEGYLVEHPDGHVTFTPRDVFERVYQRRSADSERLELIEALGNEIVRHCNQIGKSRELSLAITNAEQAVMWAVKHVNE